MAKTEAQRLAKNAYSRGWEERNSDYVKAIRRAHYERNREKILAYGREWRRRNPDKIRKYASDYIKRNPEYNRARQASRRGAVGKFTGDDLAYARVIRLDPCSYCGGPGGTADHLVAVKDGGTHAWENLTSACRSCNAKKRCLTPLDFLLKMHVSLEAGTVEEGD